MAKTAVNVEGKGVAVIAADIPGNHITRYFDNIRIGDEG